MSAITILACTMMWHDKIRTATHRIKVAVQTSSLVSGHCLCWNQDDVINDDSYDGLSALHTNIPHTLFCVFLYLSFRRHYSVHREHIIKPLLPQKSVANITRRCQPLIQFLLTPSPPPLSQESNITSNLYQPSRRTQGCDQRTRERDEECQRPPGSLHDNPAEADSPACMCELHVQDSHFLCGSQL
jgi:hypothetical protein